MFLCRYKYLEFSLCSHVDASFNIFERQGVFYSRFVGLSAQIINSVFKNIYICAFAYILGEIISVIIILKEIISIYLPLSGKTFHITSSRDEFTTGFITSECSREELYTMIYYRSYDFLR